MIYLLKSPEARKLENGEYEFFFSLKIGYTDDETPDLKKNKRLNQYFIHHRSIELLHVIPNGMEEQEKKLHYKFRGFRWDNSNEWYIYDQSIIDVVLPTNTQVDITGETPEGEVNPSSDVSPTIVVRYDEPAEEPEDQNRLEEPKDNTLPPDEKLPQTGDVTTWILAAIIILVAITVGRMIVIRNQLKK